MNEAFYSTQFFGVSAFFNAFAWLLMLVTAVLFFRVNPKWGMVNDVISVIFLLSIIPLVAYFSMLFAEEHAWQQIAAALVGMAGIIIPALGQTRLIFKRIDFHESTRYFPAFAGIGIWMVWENRLLAVYNQSIPWLVWSGMLTGAGVLSAILLYKLNQMKNAVFYLSVGLLAVGYPLWAILLGRWLLAGGAMMY